MAQKVGSRTTSQSITAENTLVRNVGEELVLLEPNGSPLLTFVMRMKKRKSVFSPRYEWLEDDYVARWAQNSSATVAANAASVTVTVTDGTLFVAGDLFTVPQAISSSLAPELIRVVSIAGDVLTVVRAQAGTTVRAINDGDAIRILGSAHEEGTTPPPAKSTTIATKTTFTQIFRTTIDLSGTQMASRQYGSPGGDRKRLHKKKLVEHKQKMNSTALFSTAGEALTGGPNGNPIRFTMGLNSRVTSNVTDAGGTLTRKTYEAFAQSAFRYGKQTKLLLSAPRIISAVHDWGNSFLMVKPNEKVFGVDVNRVVTGHGEFLLVRDWMLEDGVSGGNGFSGIAFSVDLDDTGYIYLNENGQNRDTSIRRDVVKDGRDGVVDEILTEGGYWFRHEKKFAKMFNVSDYSA
jgi:hypothetical protein